jgi:AhpD family alkylhydroperoxidase
MTRLSKLPLEQWDPELRAMAQGDTATGVERDSAAVWAQHPEFGKAMFRFAGALFQNSLLPRRLIELLRLRVAFHNQCRSCMAMRYQSALDDGLTEGLVCSLEKPEESPDLSDAEKAALAYADIAATNHFAIDEATFDELRRFYSEPQIIELGTFLGFFIGFGRMAASWDMVEQLPSGLQDKSTKVAPWQQRGALVVPG